MPLKRLDGDGSNQAKPKAFVGTRDAKDRRLLGHGAACRTTSEEASVNTAAMYLDGSAKFWWRTKRRKERRA